MVARIAWHIPKVPLLLRSAQMRYGFVRAFPQALLRVWRSCKGGTMNGDRDFPVAVTATLPGGTPIKVEVTGASADDGMASVGLRDLDLNSALDAISEIGSVIVAKLKAARPTKATVELHLGFAVESGKLIALWVGGKGEASLTVTMEWSEKPSAGQDG